MAGQNPEADRSVELGVCEVAPGGNASISTTRFSTTRFSTTKFSVALDLLLLEFGTFDMEG
jgi:hypothetical protein